MVLEILQVVPIDMFVECLEKYIDYRLKPNSVLRGWGNLYSLEDDKVKWSGAFIILATYQLGGYRRVRRLPRRVAVLPHH